MLGHIALATVHPRTKESLRGMLFGRVDADWARAHHPRWYAEVCQEPSGQAEGMPTHSHVGELLVPATPSGHELIKAERPGALEAGEDLGEVELARDRGCGVQRS